MRQREPEQLVVFDAEQACPYLPDRCARMPLRLPVQPLSREQLDARLRSGDRRSGPYLYNTHCPGCLACEPIRLEVHRFRPSRSQRRVWRRGNQLLRTTVGRPRVDEHRVRLFNKHRRDRDLAGLDDDVDASSYGMFLVQSCCETFELRYLLEGQLVAVALCDRGVESLSAVYCYYDPDLSKLSLGTYSILKQIEYCRQQGLRYLYLGYYIALSRPMAYKAGFRPHQRRIGGQWREFA